MSQCSKLQILAIYESYTILHLNSALFLLGCFLHRKTFFILRLSTFSLMTFLGFWREAAMMVFQDHHLGFILYGICWPYRLWIISNHHNVLENLIFIVFRKYFFEKPLMVPSTFLDLGVMIIYSKMIRKVDFRAARIHTWFDCWEHIFLINPSFVLIKANLSLHSGINN